MLLVRFGCIIFITPCAMLFHVCISVRSFLWPISISICHMYTAYLAFINRANSFASAANNITALMICEIISTALLFQGNRELFDR